VPTGVSRPAPRPRKAAKEIKGLIENSGREVTEGVRLVDATGVALHEIEQFVASIDNNMQTLATAAREQSVGLSEINNTVAQLDRMTQQNAAMVERSTDISLELATGAERLSELVNHFKLNRRSAIREPGSDVNARRVA